MISMHLGKKRIVELNINGVEYIATLDNYAIDHFQKHNKKGLLKAIDELGHDNITSMIELLGSLIREKKTNKIVGIEFVKQFDVFDTITHLSPVLTELFAENLPEATEEEQKK